MIETLSQDDARRLMAHTGEACVSIYMPTRPQAAAEVEEERLRLRNLLDEAERRMRARGARSAAARDLLAPARGLLSDTLFWRRQAQGLAIFIGSGVFERRSLPIRFRAEAHVEGRFHLKPVLPLLSGDGMYFAMLLHKFGVRLFEGSRDAMHEVSLNGAPEGLARLLEETIEPMRDRQNRVVGKGYRGVPQSIVSGGGSAPGGAVVEPKTRTLEYYQLIDKALRPVLRERGAPLILAGLGSLMPIYREANTYPGLHPEGVAHGAESLTERDLHLQTWSIVAPTFAEVRQRWAKRFNDLRHAGRAIDSLGQVVRAAREGRVEAIFVSLDQERWGEIDPDSDEPVEHPKRRDEDEDLLNLAAIESALRGAAAYALHDDELAEHGVPSPVGAVLRC